MVCDMNVSVWYCYVLLVKLMQGEQGEVLTGGKIKALYEEQSLENTSTVSCLYLACGLSGLSVQEQSHLLDHLSVFTVSPGVLLCKTAFQGVKTAIWHLLLF